MEETLTGPEGTEVYMDDIYCILIHGETEKIHDQGHRSSRSQVQTETGGLPPPQKSSTVMRIFIMSVRYTSSDTTDILVDLT